MDRLQKLQECKTPQEYLQTQLGFQTQEVNALAKEFAHIDRLSVSEIHRNVETIRCLGHHVRRVKAIVQACPPLLELDLNAFIAFFYSYGADKHVCSSSHATPYT